MGHQEPQGVVAVRGGTGSASLAPPWSREQVRWLGKGFFVLRLAGDETSRWLLGASFRETDVLPHERTFRRSAADKCELMRKLKMNPWPAHLASDDDPLGWRSAMARATEALAPELDTGYVTLWRLPQLPGDLVPRGPLVVLDGHHSRRAQINLGAKSVLGWVEPLANPQLRVRAIERAGWLARWLEVLTAAGELRALTGPPSESEWTMGDSLAFEVVQTSRRWWCEIVKPLKGEAVVDALARLGKERVYLKGTPSFEEALGWMERFEIDTALRLPPPTKAYARTRARAHRLLPQKATYFHPKVPFGILVEDLAR